MQIEKFLTNHLKTGRALWEIGEKLVLMFIYNGLNKKSEQIDNHCYLGAVPAHKFPGLMGGMLITSVRWMSSRL